MKDFDDDGRVVARMDIDGMERRGLFNIFPYLNRPSRKLLKEKTQKRSIGFDGIELTKGEKRAMFKAGMLFTLQVCAVTGGMFFLIFLLMKLWLKV